MEETDESNRRERAYKCQRCLNHNRLVSRKGHQCPYKECFCSGCDLNNLRSKLMTVLRERGLNHTEVFLTKKSGRKQHCMLCSFHGDRVELRGHKRNCPWAKCECTLCTIGRHYRDTMAKQTKHRRSQRRSGSNDKSPIGQIKFDDGKSGDGSSRRVSMKRDWRRGQQVSPVRISPTRESASRDDGNGSESPSKDGSHLEIDVTSAQSDTSAEHSSISAGPITPDRSGAGLFQSGASIWPSVPLLGPSSNAYGLFNNPLSQPANMLSQNSFPSHPFRSPIFSSMAASLAAQQQRQATDLALAFLLSRYNSIPSGVFPPVPPNLCLNCHQSEVTPSTANTCQQGHTLPKMDQYVNALREYPSTTTAHVTLPTILHQTETWPQAAFFFK